MSYVILDLEWNGSYSKVMHKFINEIIEFGAVKIDDNFNVIDKFSILIYPKIGGKICSKVKQLTKITNEELKQDGIMFMDAVKSFCEFSEDSVIVTWSTSDIHALIENYLYYTGDFHLPFLSRYCNMQEFCEDCLDVHDSSSQLGLSACAEILGIDFSEEEHHRAVADAELSLKCFAALAAKFDVNDYIKDCTEEFYDRMMFKAHFITDIKAPEVDKSVMKFNCDSCGKRIKQIARWRIHNKAFVSDFECDVCKKKYIGRVSFKKKYDEVIIHKKLTEKVSKKQTEKTEDKVEQLT